MCDDYSESADMNDVKFLDHVLRDFPKGVHSLKQDILRQVFIDRVLEAGNVHTFELPCRW